MTQKYELSMFEAANIMKAITKLEDMILSREAKDQVDVIKRNIQYDFNMHFLKNAGLI